MSFLMVLVVEVYSLGDQRTERIFDFKYNVHDNLICDVYLWEFEYLNWSRDRKVHLVYL